MYLDIEKTMRESFDTVLQETELEIGMTLKEAVERLTPKQVRAEPIGNIKLHFCPTCGVRFIRWGFKHCGECGQALTWD